MVLHVCVHARALLRASSGVVQLFCTAARMGMRVFGGSDNGVKAAPIVLYLYQKGNGEWLPHAGL